MSNSKEMPRLRKGMKTAMSSKGYYGIQNNPNTTFSYNDNIESKSGLPLSPASSAAHISQIYNRADLAIGKTTGHKSQLSHHN